MNLNGPALAPPPGVTPDFESPPNNNPLAIGVISACTAVSTICLLLRAYARVWLQRRVQIEEGVHLSCHLCSGESITDCVFPVLTLCAYGCFWGAMYAEIRLIDTPGYFVHQWNVRLKDMIPTTYVSPC